MLDISYNHLGNTGVEQLTVGLMGKISLKKLSMVDCKFGRGGAEIFFQNIGRNASMTELRIDQNKVGKALHGPAGPSVIESFRDFFKDNHCLKKLSMSQCDLADESMDSFCFGLALNSTLNVLNLKDNSISNKGAKGFADAFA